MSGYYINPFETGHQVDIRVNNKILEKTTMLQLKLGIHSNIVLQENYNKSILLEQELVDKNKAKSQNEYIFVTFNFNTECQNLISSSKFKDKLVSKESMEEYAYCYEQRGETLDEIGKGLHMHFLIKRNKKKPSEWTRELYSTFKNYTGFSLDDFKNPKYRMCCFVPKSWAKEKLAYMSGEKWDEDKNKKCEMDIIFRKNNNLNLIYNKNLII